MKILVTGGAGYIGSVLCEHLLDAGHTVTVLDNLMYGQRSLFHLCHNHNFFFVKGDARDLGVLREQCKTADAIIPLAALVGAPACERDPDLAHSLNYLGIVKILQCTSKDQLVIYPNTNSGYGHREGVCTEETPLNPISVYGKTKMQAETALLNCEGTISLRLATAFGASPRMRFDLLINHFVHTAVTHGSITLFEAGSRRNFIHVRDIADAFCFFLEHPKPGIYNLGLDSANLSKRELAEKVGQYIPFRVHLDTAQRDPDGRDYEVSSEKLYSLGFRPKRTLEDGILELMTALDMLPRGEWANA